MRSSSADRLRRNERAARPAIGDAARRAVQGPDRGVLRNLTALSRQQRRGGAIIALTFGGAVPEAPRIHRTHSRVESAHSILPGSLKNKSPSASQHRSEQTRHHLPVRTSHIVPSCA